MTSKAESHDDMAEAERLGADMDKWSAGLIPIPASMVGRGGIHDTAWLTLSEALRLSAAMQALLQLVPPPGRTHITDMTVYCGKALTT